MAKANDDSVSVAEFQKFLQKASLTVCKSDSPRNYRCLCICGLPNSGKSAAGTGLPFKVFQGHLGDDSVQQVLQMGQ